MYACWYVDIYMMGICGSQACGYYMGGREAEVNLSFLMKFIFR